MDCLLYVFPSPDATKRLVSALPDIVVVDLEEAVAEPGKAKARSRLVDTVAAFGPLGIRVLVRVNGAGTEHWHLDLAEVKRLAPDVGLLLPKPLDESIVRSIGAAHPGRPLWLMAESCDVPQWLPDVLAEVPIAGLVIGGKDLCLDLCLDGYQPAHELVRQVVDEVVRIAWPYQVPVFDAVAFGEDDVRRALIRADLSGCVGLSLVSAEDVHISRGLD